MNEQDAHKKEMGIRIKRLLEDTGISDDMLVEKLSINSAASLAKWWGGRSYPKVPDLIQISKMTGRSLDFIMTGEEPSAQGGKADGEYKYLYEELKQIHSVVRDRLIRLEENA